MDKVFRRYNKIFGKVWLSLSMVSNSVKSFEIDKEAKPFPMLLSKAGYTNLTESERIISENIQNWEEVQDRILRVLTYKYYDSDLMLVHSNENYLHDTSSAFSLKEEELENFYLQEFPGPLEVKVAHEFRPILEQPQIVTVAEGNTCGRIWNCVRNVLTLKTCRQT